jgi:hypothetical protein
MRHTPVIPLFSLSFNTCCHPKRVLFRVSYHQSLQLPVATAPVTVADSQLPSFVVFALLPCFLSFLSIKMKLDAAAALQLFSASLLLINSFPAEDLG